MNCNLYINDDLFASLENYRKAHNQSRNSVITTAIKTWLESEENKEKDWPESFFDFPEELKGIYPDISELRKDILPLKEIKF
jgi:hypothetical protein